MQARDERWVLEEPVDRIGVSTTPFLHLFSAAPFLPEVIFSAGTAEGMAPGPMTGRCKDGRVSTIWLGLGSQENSEGF